MTASKLSVLDNFLNLFFPKLCLACGKNLPSNTEYLCLRCHYKLPKTEFHKSHQNPFMEKFWGRLPLHSAAALYYFNKGGLCQKVIHNLKYKDKKSIGIQLGELYGHQLKQSPHFRTIDLIIPIPLHYKKEKARGYNQSNLFAKGLSHSMRRPWHRDLVLRKSPTGTQTKKSRLERMTNVEDVFFVRQPHKLNNRHILLVDDVLTTGATLEACALKILKSADAKISFATIAYAKM